MDMSNAPKTYRLGSCPSVYAPGVIRWAINGYAFKRDQKIMLKFVMTGWNIPEAAATALLSKAVPYTVDDDVVVFMA